MKLIVPFPAEGPLDGTARLLAERLTENLKQPFIIENRAGAAGNIGPKRSPRRRPMDTPSWWCSTRL